LFFKISNLCLFQVDIAGFEVIDFMS
jgi:hypothetical protein